MSELAIAPRYWAMRKELHGNALSEALDYAGMSAEDLAKRLNTLGFRTERGKQYNYDYVWNRVNDRLASSPYFLRQVKEAIGLPEEWPLAKKAIKGVPRSHHFQLQSEQGGDFSRPLVPMRAVPFLPPVGEIGLKDSLASIENWSQHIVVPDFLGANFPAVPIVDDSMHPVATRGDVLILKPGELVRPGKAYALTMLDGTGEYRRAYINNGRTMLYAIDPAAAPVSPEAVFVDALVVGLLPQYIPGMPRGAFDISGLDFAEWPEPK